MLRDLIGLSAAAHDRAGQTHLEAARDYDRCQIASQPTDQAKQERCMRSLPDWEMFQFFLSAGNVAAASLPPLSGANCDI
jgi:hypothetical protein